MLRKVLVLGLVLLFATSCFAIKRGTRFTESDRIERSDGSVIIKVQRWDGSPAVPVSSGGVEVGYHVALYKVPLGDEGRIVLTPADEAYTNSSGIVRFGGEDPAASRRTILRAGQYLAMVRRDITSGFDLDPVMLGTPPAPVYFIYKGADISFTMRFTR